MLVQSALEEMIKFLYQMKKANTETDFKEMSNLLGAKWGTITAEGKKPYEERYQAEKEAYLKIIGNKKREHEAMRLLEDKQKHKTAMELLEQYLQFKQEAEKDTKKTEKEKQPMSAYFIFANECRAALRAENKNTVEVAKITGEEWKNMSEKDRAPYEEMALKNREQYAQEMEMYKQKKEEESANVKKEEEEIMKLQKQEAMQVLKKEGKNRDSDQENQREAFTVVTVRLDVRDPIPIYETILLLLNAM